MPDGRLLHLRDTYPIETAWAPPYVGDELRQVRAAAREARLAGLRASAEAAAAGHRGDPGTAARQQELAASYQALHEAYRQRETVFAAIMADRADWDAATRAQRHLAVAADTELRRRHPGQHYPPLRSAEPEPATETQRAELTLTPGEQPGEMGQWIKDLAAAHRTFAERLADRQSLTIPSEDPGYGDLGQAFPPWPAAGQRRDLAATQAGDPAFAIRTRTRRGPRRRPGGRRLRTARSPRPYGASAGALRRRRASQECADMYRITVSASRLSAYRSESGSSWQTRHTPSRLSQKADQHRCSAKNAAMRAAA